MNMKSLIAFVDAFKAHETSVESGRSYVREYTAPKLLEALAALPAEISEHIAFDLMAEGAYDDVVRLVQRSPEGPAKEMLASAAKLLAIPFADSIVRLANAPEPSPLATDGEDDGLTRALLDTGAHPAHAAE